MDSHGLPIAEDLKNSSDGSDKVKTCFIVIVNYMPKIPNVQ